jgi:hypothetical protein
MVVALSVMRVKVTVKRLASFIYLKKSYAIVITADTVENPSISF